MDKPFVRWCRLSVMCVVSCCVFFFSSLSFSADRVDVITIKGGIGPAVADYMVKALGKSNAEQAKLVVLTMDTPGGLSAAMRRMIQSILASSVPVVGFVTPSGARAASAGTYLLYAAHIAAMTPGTNLGAATPVSLFGGSADKQGKEKNKKDAAPSPSAMEKKVVNDAKAYIRSLAQLRGRNVDWAERAVSEGASLTANEALKQSVINFMSTDLTSLLKQVNGQVVSVKNKPYTIQLRDPVVRTIEPTWREQILIWLTSPSVAYILLMVGIYGLFLSLLTQAWWCQGW